MEEEDVEDEDHGLTYDERILNYRVELAEVRAGVLKQGLNEFEDFLA